MRRRRGRRHHYYCYHLWWRRRVRFSAFFKGFRVFVFKCISFRRCLCIKTPSLNTRSISPFAISRRLSLSLSLSLFPLCVYIFVYFSSSTSSLFVRSKLSLLWFASSFLDLRFCRALKLIDFFHSGTFVDVFLQRRQVGQVVASLVVVVVDG